ncbi:hypothetical protein H072_6335 [Dactylellina haptotyla CBS 200.50]|uniref:Uncharacterized protein n=1 Tax=Dactylellina haptotyla (strain CBS 200.50) TaxID=1284197 RepID=S8AA59_DACHA|nr:hypothetical protein H072_6335 [Dactylellina haptotyla CBS 200.50]
MKMLSTRFDTLFDYLDAWTCENKLTSKSMTYYTLFLRKVEDVHAAIKLDKEPALHFSDIAEVEQPVFPWYSCYFLEATFDQDVDPNFHVAADILADSLRKRISDTERLMELIDKDEPPTDPNDFFNHNAFSVKEQCAKVKGKLPKFV